MEFESSRSFARRLDKQDSLSPFRTRFAIPEPDLVYLDGNSLGRQAFASAERLQRLTEEWGRDLVRGFNQDWWQAPGRVGEKIARLLGAGPGQIVACDTVSVNLFKLSAAALTLDPRRTKIVTDTLNFPSDLYILQGLVRMLGDRHTIVRIGSKNGEVTPDLDALEAAIDKDTALITLSHVTFKSGYLYDMAAITELAHRRGALVLWDLSHSAGAVPVALDACNADFAIGCTYKYLNGGPGSPAFLYVCKNLQEQVASPIWGWWGQKEPFAFGLDYVPAPGITRFLTGTQCAISHSRRMDTQDGQVGTFAGQFRVTDGKRVVTLEKTGKPGVFQYLADNNLAFGRVARFLHVPENRPRRHDNLDLRCGHQIAIPVRTLAPSGNAIDIPVAQRVINRRIADLAAFTSYRFHDHNVTCQRVAKIGPQPQSE